MDLCILAEEFGGTWEADVVCRERTRRFYCICVMEMETLGNIFILFIYLFIFVGLPYLPEGTMVGTHKESNLANL